MSRRFSELEGHGLVYLASIEESSGYLRKAREALGASGIGERDFELYFEDQIKLPSLQYRARLVFKLYRAKDHEFVKRIMARNLYLSNIVVSEFIWHEYLLGTAVICGGKEKLLQFPVVLRADLSQNGNANLKYLLSLDLQDKNHQCVSVRFEVKELPPHSVSSNSRIKTALAKTMLKLQLSCRDVNWEVRPRGQVQK